MNEIKTEIVKKHFNLFLNLFLLFTACVIEIEIPKFFGF